MPIVFKTDNAGSYLDTLYVGGLTTLPSGRKLYRHKTLPGSVLMFNDGVDRSVLIPDAKYRIGTADGNVRFGWSVIDNPNLANVDGSKLLLTDLEGFPNTPDNVINSIDIFDPKTSRSNTTALVTDYPSDSPPEAALHCRSVVIGDNFTCDLPNVNTLIRMFLEREYIDELDPTIDTSDTSIQSNVYRSLTKMFETGSIISSTSGFYSLNEYRYRMFWEINLTLGLDKTTVDGVVAPVYEL